MKWPFRYRFWVLFDTRGCITIRRSRLNPAMQSTAPFELIDGPFDTNEDAVQSLDFWDRQLKVMLRKEQP